MGVIPCDRRDCENIMCDRQGQYGRICNECFAELVKSGSNDIAGFMESRRLPMPPDLEAARLEWLEDCFPDYWTRHDS